MDREIVDDGMFQCVAVCVAMCCGVVHAKCILGMAPCVYDPLLIHEIVDHGVSQYVAVCRSVVQCAAKCRSVLRCDAVRCSAHDPILEGITKLLITVCCNVLRCVVQCVAVWCSVCCSVLQCVVVYCGVLQYVAVCCIVLQCVTVFCSAVRSSPSISCYS